MPVEKKKLSFVTILFITINSIMGTGIFFLPAVGAREAGLFSLVSWVIMGLVATYFASIFGELVSRFPREGGVYEYAKEAFGFFPSFLLGWMTLIAANITIAMLMVGAIKYIGGGLDNLFIAGISIVFILIFNYIAFRGLRTGKFMLLAFAFITLLSVFGIMIPGLWHFDPGQFTGWLAHASFSGLSGLPGVFSGVLVVFVTVFFIAETFFGWETVTFLAEEVHDPRKVMPRALIWGTVIIAVISVLFVVASMSLIRWDLLGSTITPLADLATAVYGPGAAAAYSLLVYLAIVGSVAGWIIAAPNLLVALAKDRLFIPSFAKKHRKTGTPYKAILFQTVLTSVIVLIGAGNYENLLHLLVPMVLFMYAFVVVSLIVIRRKQPVFSGYHAPGGKLGPWLLVVFTLGLIVLWALNTTGAGHILRVVLSLILLGVPVYLTMNFYYNPKAAVMFQDKTLMISRLTERMFLPRRIRRRILEGGEPHHRVLFLSAGSGLVVKEAVMREENTIIVEQSRHLVRHLQRRFPRAQVLHDEHLTSRVHPDVEEVDIVISVGLFSHLQDLRTYLEHIKALIPENAKIRFFDYVDFYKVLPNAAILDDLDELKRTFKEKGFSIKVEKVRGLLWNYLIIEGIKTDRDVTYI